MTVYVLWRPALKLGKEEGNGGKENIGRCQRLRCIAMLRVCVYDRVPGALHTELWFWDHQSPTRTQTYSYAQDSSFTSARINMQPELMETSACNRRGSSYRSQFSVFPPILLGQLRHNHNINKDFFLISSAIDHTLLILEEILVVKMIYNSAFSLYIGFS